jgi:probable rRNA maturation factor
VGKLVLLRKKIAGLSRAALEGFVLRVRYELRLRGMVNVLLTSSTEMRRLNRQFRHKDKATDVLSFPSLEAVRTSPRAAGELAISLDIARENAIRLGHSLAEEVKVLVLHGILHLAGFDHERDNGEMAREELRLRKKLKLNVSLIERSSSQSAIRTRRSVSTVARRRNP